VPGVLELTSTAARVGHYVWFERRVFEVVGGWVRTTEPADLTEKLWFGEVARRHAWHAELWHERLPELREMDRSALTVPASADVVDLFAELADTSPTLDRLTGLVRVLYPHYQVALADHRDRVAPLADGSILRTIELVRRDVAHDAEAGERLLQRQLGTDADRHRLVRAQADFEEFLTPSAAFGSFPPT
jgi:hypothetical protein